MKRFTTLLLAAVATISLTTSCKKDSVEGTVQPQNQTLPFVGKSFVMASFQVDPAIDFDGDGKLDTDLTTFLRACDRDNTIIFASNGSLSGSNGQLSCSTDQADPSAFKPSHWTYNESTKTIRIVKDNDATDVAEWKILESTASSLKVDVDVNDPTRDYKTIITWKAL
ncbi:hypothetical protein GCM10028805_44530 [Spirosoma harenae]